MTVEAEPRSGIGQHVLDLLPNLVKVALGAGDPEAVRRLTTLENAVRQHHSCLVVLGEFSTGKSSLLNALLSTPELFPVDSDVSTRALTSASWSETESIRVTLAGRDGEAAHHRTVTREELRGYLCEAAVIDGEGAPDADRVTEASIVTPSPPAASRGGRRRYPGDRRGEPGPHRRRARRVAAGRPGAVRD